jgi:hypothetical protein
MEVRIQLHNCAILSQGSSWLGDCVGLKEWSGSSGEIEIPFSVNNRALVLTAVVMKNSIFSDITALHHRTQSCP